jgi:hypothetical protein
MARSEDFKTPLVRFSFVQHLFEVQVKKNGSKQWNCTLLIPKGIDISAFEKAIVEAGEREWGDKFVAMVKNGLIKNPLLDGDGPQGIHKETGERHAGYAGHLFIRPTSGENYRPKLVNQKVLPITSQDELYSGCYGYAVLNAYAWTNDEGGKGVSFGMSMIQKAKDGERLGGGGGVDVDKWAEKIDDEGDAPAATKSGAGAGGLFS